MTTPKHKNSCLGGQIYNSDRPFLGNYCFKLCFSDLCSGVEKKILLHKGGGFKTSKLGEQISNVLLC